MLSFVILLRSFPKINKSFCTNQIISIHPSAYNKAHFYFSFGIAWKFSCIPEVLYKLRSWWGRIPELISIDFGHASRDLVPHLLFLRFPCLFFCFFGLMMMIPIPILLMLIKADTSSLPTEILKPTFGLCNSLRSSTTIKERCGIYGWLQYL